MCPLFGSCIIDKNLVLETVTVEICRIISRYDAVVLLIVHIEEFHVYEIRCIIHYQTRTRAMPLRTIVSQ